MQLYEVCRQVSTELERRYANDPMGLLRAKGELASRSGFLAGMVCPNDPEDPDKVRRLREAALSMGIAL